jgi:hypothetical protein
MQARADEDRRPVPTLPVRFAADGSSVVALAARACAAAIKSDGG